MNEDYNKLIERIEKLEEKALRIDMEPREKENIKNNLFEGYAQADKADVARDADTPYLKVIWKNKIIYIPYFI